MTLDSKAKAGQVKGFVVNPRKDDVKVFDFSENDDQVIEVIHKCKSSCNKVVGVSKQKSTFERNSLQVSPFFITNYIWDLIAAGTDPSWTKLVL